MLIGRAAEWAGVDGALTAAREGRGGTVLVRGEAGVGKTSLLDRAAQGPGLRVLRAAGVEAETDLAYAAAHQFAYPLLELLPELPAAQAVAVRVALGLEAGDTPDRFLVALGLLSLVSEAARAEPLLLILDDVQWWDASSMDAILFVARRIAAEPVAVLMSVREEPGSDEVIASVSRLSGLVELRLDRLGDAHAADLVTAIAGFAPPEAVSRRLVEIAHGNPLALVELVRGLPADQLAGHDPLPENVSLGDRLERPFLERASGLSPEARRLLLVAASEPSGELGLLADAADVSDVGGLLDEIETSTLASYDGRRLSFSHPVARAALYSDAGARERRDTHQRLATVLGDRGLEDRAVWHRAEAALGTDDGLADALVEVAERAQARSGHAAAAAAYERAADLSSHSVRRVEALTAAAGAAWLAGQPARARLLVQRAEPEASTPVARGRLLALQARTASRNGEVEQAHRLFLSAADLVGPEDPREALELLAEAVEVDGYTGDLERLAEVRAQTERLVLPDPDERQRFLLAWISVNDLSWMSVDDGILRRTADDVDYLLEALGSGLGGPRSTVWAGVASLQLGFVTGMQERYTQALDQARQAGAAASLPYVLEHASARLAFDGNYVAARSAAEEGLRLAREYEQPRSAGQLLAVLAFVAATTGDVDETQQRADEAREIAGPRGIGLTNAMTAWALARLDLGLGRNDEALERLLALASAKPGQGHSVITMWSTPDLVEAAARARRTDEVLEHLAGMAERARISAQPTTEATATWCRGMLGGPNAVTDLGTAAEELLRIGFPVASARARLSLGELLRRDRQPRAAREHLRSALELFRQCGATVWAERAAAELRASGDGVPVQEVDGIASLTAQELQIARYVSMGATNKDIAAQLFLSPRTVEYHLYKAYPKLGVSSRSQLISRFAEELATAGV
jgi:DNA-binding CsgD family transcriptional regulator